MEAAGTLPVDHPAPHRGGETYDRLRRPSPLRPCRRGAGTASATKTPPPARGPGGRAARRAGHPPSAGRSPARRASRAPRAASDAGPRSRGCAGRQLGAQALAGQVERPVDRREALRLERDPDAAPLGHLVDVTEEAEAGDVRDRVHLVRAQAPRLRPCSASSSSALRARAAASRSRPACGRIIDRPRCRAASDDVGPRRPAGRYSHSR